MSKRNDSLPKPTKIIIHKSEILKQLVELDNNVEGKKRVLEMENRFRNTIDLHVKNLLGDSEKFSAYKTNPLVLLMYCFKNKYSRVSQIEGDILPAKLFSSMETSAGKMAELITFPTYGWNVSTSTMHSSDSALDGSKVEGDILKLATLKSGPRCLNDEMSENFADAIIANAQKWAANHKLKEIDFTYGVLYGTQAQSNKKDWHILRNLMEKLPVDCFEVLPTNRWECLFTMEETKIKVSIRIGADWWNYLGGRFGLLEFVIAIIRATVLPGNEDPSDHRYRISNLESIVHTTNLPGDFNVSILQRSQISWLYLVLSHYCDSLLE